LKPLPLLWGFARGAGEEASSRARRCVSPPDLLTATLVLHADVEERE
jgi:hypothetical protein